MTGGDSERSTDRDRGVANYFLTNPDFRGLGYPVHSSRARGASQLVAVVAFLGCRPGKRPAVAWATFFSKEKPDFWLIFKEELSGTTAFFSQRKRHSESAPKLFRAFFFARSSRRLRKKTSESGFFCAVFFCCGWPQYKQRRLRSTALFQTYCC